MTQLAGMKEPLRILYLEDNRADVELAKAILQREPIPCNLTDVLNQADFTAALKQDTLT